ncbi:hypothetical protein LUZ60_003496 [Juncus effusus]|nr:hypothetical protein LUZ60_003496 [Juncus effusus]
MADFNSRYRNENHEAFYDYQNGAGLKHEFYDCQKGTGLKNEFYDRQNGTGLKNESNAVVPYQNPDAFKMFVSAPPVRKEEFAYRLPPVRKDKTEAKSASIWCFNDPEMKRKRRVASYKSYSVEGKVKNSIKKGYRWIKIKCSELIHGW